MSPKKLISSPILRVVSVIIGGILLLKLLFSRQQPLQDQSFEDILLSGALLAIIILSVTMYLIREVIHGIKMISRENVNKKPRQKTILK